MSVAPRSRRLSSCSLPRLRSHPIHRFSPSLKTRRRCRMKKRSLLFPDPSADTIGGVETRDRFGRGGEKLVVAVDVLLVCVQPVRQQGDSGVRRRGWRDDGPPVARSAQPDPRHWSAGWEPRPACEGCGGMPWASSRPGSAVAPKICATARLISAVAASIAGNRPTMAKSARYQPPAAGPHSRSSRADRSRAAVTTAMTADIAPDRPCCMLRRPRRRRSGGRKPIPASKAGGRRRSGSSRDRGSGLHRRNRLRSRWPPSAPAR